jgi:hypothetical protein
MSIQVGGDILVHLRKLVNLDCFSFGQYRIKIEVEQTGGTGKPVQGRQGLTRNFLPAYFIPPKPFDDSKTCRLAPPVIAESGAFYISQTFMFKSYTEGVD